MNFERVTFPIIQTTLPGGNKTTFVDYNQDGEANSTSQRGRGTSKTEYLEPALDQSFQDQVELGTMLTSDSNPDLGLDTVEVFQSAGDVKEANRRADKSLTAEAEGLFGAGTGWEIDTEAWQLTFLIPK